MSPTPTMPSPEENVPRLKSHCAAWDRQDSSRFKRALSSTALIVIDTNVLLSIYGVHPDVRPQILNALRAVRERLWIPDQVAVEFSRNRRRVIIDAATQFKKARKSLDDAVKKSADSICLEIDKLVKLRGQNQVSRPWDPGILGIDRTGLTDSLKEVVRAVSEELSMLEDEQTFDPGNLHDNDEILDELDDILADKIGTPLSSSEVQELVEVASTYRYPNKIPPGYADWKPEKRTDVVVAGDYILWNQTLREARRNPQLPDVLIITGDVKPDWWMLSEGESGRPLGPRPELIHEMAHEAKSHLLLATLADFLDGAREYLKTSISKETLQEVREFEAALAISASIHNLTESRPYIDLSSLSDQNIYDVVNRLFTKLRYGISTNSRRDGNVLFLMGKKPPFSQSTYVDIRRSTSSVNSNVIRHVINEMNKSGVNEGLVITNGRFTADAVSAAASAGIVLVDGPRLAALLKIHLGLNVGLSEE